MERDPFAYEEGEGTEVAMGDIKTSKAPGSLRTSGLGPCLGIALFDSTKRRGSLGHSTGYPDKFFLENFGKELKKYYKDKTIVKIWLRGVSQPTLKDNEENPGLNESCIKSRLEVINFLKNLGFKEDQIDVNWQQSPLESTTITLDLSSGTMQSDTEEV